MVGFKNGQLNQMINRIGIMQGRLSPVINGKIQTFPFKTWKEEFPLAKECCFDLIEWVLDSADWQQNPLFSSSGRKEIIRLQKEYEVYVSAVCCDYFMEYPLNTNCPETQLQSQRLLTELIHLCPEVGIKFIELPLVGRAEIKKEEDAEIVIDLLNSIVSLLVKQDLYLLLELNLNPAQIDKLLKNISSNRIQLNYDMGNSAYWGYNPIDELHLYGKRIGNIHIKDCTPSDYSVPLGKGNVNFDLIFKLLKEMSYQGDFILQAARGKDDIQTAKAFYKFTHSYIQRYLR